MKKGKKVTLTEKERKDLELGNISSEKQTESYKKAKAIFDDEKQKIINEGNALTQETHFWFDHDQYAFKMRFVYESHQDQKLKNFGEMLADIFKSNI